MKSLKDAQEPTAVNMRRLYSEGRYYKDQIPWVSGQQGCARPWSLCSDTAAKACEHYFKH